MTCTITTLTFGLLLAAGTAAVVAAAPAATPDLAAAAGQANATLLAKHGPGERARIERGVAQVARLWRAEDGDAQAFRAFVEAEFIPQGPALDATFERFEFALERISGYYVSMTRDLRRGTDLEIGPLLPLDSRLAAYSPQAHFLEDMFASKLAFVALVNFPATTLDERLKHGLGWSRRAWAEARLAQQFAARVPAEVMRETTRAYAEAEAYIAGYNIRMHHLLTPQGERLFPAGLRLISHWNLRDELKSHYAGADKPAGLARQRMIARVMERIVRQEIPAAVIDNPLLDWTPETGAVVVSSVKDGEAPEGAVAEPRSEREADERYRQWLGIYQAERLADPYTPNEPTFMARRFNLNREIPEPEVEALFESVLASPLAPRVAKLIEQRLGRPLEPFDIWYAGFKPRGRYTEAELDARTKQRYKTPADYAADIPRLLSELGFADARARFVADHIEVDPSRGAGHAMGAGRRDDKAHLRTRIGKDGMDYKGYNIAVHEMGHNVEQVFSMTTIDHTLLQGVPNNAFTEALAFVFQAQDLRLLGLSAEDPKAADMRALEEFWATREIAGVSLVDMQAWRWLYAHPQATPAEFRAAVVAIAQDVWNRHFAALLGARDVSLLAIYSHMVSSGLYLPDYAIGHLIAFQVEAHFKAAKAPFGAEFERITQQGSITPDAWMRLATGAPLSAEPLLSAAARATAALEAAAH